MSKLSAKQSVYCPTCKRHTSQERGAKRGTRYCGVCGETFTLAESRVAAQGLSPAQSAILDAIPSNWLDPLLTGKDAVIGPSPYTGKDIERLLNTIRERLREILLKENEGRASHPNKGE